MTIDEALARIDRCRGCGHPVMEAASELAAEVRRLRKPKLDKPDRRGWWWCSDDADPIYITLANAQMIERVKGVAWQYIPKPDWDDDGDAVTEPQEGE